MQLQATSVFQIRVNEIHPPGLRLFRLFVFDLVQKIRGVLFGLDAERTSAGFHFSDQPIVQLCYVVLQAKDPLFQSHLATASSKERHATNQAKIQKKSTDHPEFDHHEGGF